MFLCIHKVLFWKQLLVFLCEESLAAIAAVVDFRLVQVDVHPRVAKGPSPSITPYVCALDNHHSLLSQKGDSELLVDLEGWLDTTFHNSVASVLPRYSQKDSAVFHEAQNYEVIIIVALPTYFELLMLFAPQTTSL